MGITKIKIPAINANKGINTEMLIIGVLPFFISPAFGAQEFVEPKCMLNKSDCAENVKRRFARPIGQAKISFAFHSIMYIIQGRKNGAIMAL